MKHYSIIIHNEKVILVLEHKDWIDAFVSLLESYNSTFQTELGADTTSFYKLKEENILQRSLDHDNSYTFQIIEKTF